MHLDVETVPNVGAPERQDQTLIPERTLFGAAALLANFEIRLT